MKSDPLQSDQCAKRLKALSERTRLRLVQALRAGPRTVGELCEDLGIELVTVSHHLTILRHAGLVERQRRGRFAVYRLPVNVFKRAKSKTGLEHLNLGCCRLEIPRK